MYISQGNKITIPRGDTAEISVTLVDETTEQPYILQTGEKLRFDLFSINNAAPIVSREGTEQEADGTVSILLTSSDTTMLSGTYKYMVRLISGETADTIIGLENDAYCVIK